MPHVQLFGSDVPRTVSIPCPHGKGEIPISPVADAKSYYERLSKAVFATLKGMQKRFHTSGISTEDFWSMIKSEYGIVSRTELTVEQWAVIYARLNACRRDARAFNLLVAEVNVYSKSCAVEKHQRVTPQDDTSKAVTEPSVQELVPGAAENIRVYRISHLDEKDRIIYEASPTEDEDDIFKTRAGVCQQIRLSREMRPPQPTPHQEILSVRLARRSRRATHCRSQCTAGN